MMHALYKQFFAYPADFVSHLFLLLPVLIALYRRAFLTPVLVVVTLYFGFRFLEESLFLVYALQSRNNHSLIKASLILDCALIGYVAFLSIRSTRFSRQLMGLLSVVVFGATLVNFLLNGSLGFNKFMVRLLMIVLSLTYFNQILAENRVKRVVHHSFFWISAGFLFYGMGTFMTAVFSDYLVGSSREAYNQFSDMEQWVSVVLSILCAVGLWVGRYDRENYLQPS